MSLISEGTCTDWRSEISHDRCCFTRSANGVQ